jgi:hypothetical protein
MRLEYVLLANYAEARNDGLVSLLGGGIRVYDVSVLPHTEPVFYLVARAIFTSEERGRVFSFSMQINDPQGMLILETESACMPGQSQYPELEDTVNFLFAFQNFTFVVAGLYKLTFRLDDLDPVELPILVHQKRAE